MRAQLLRFLILGVILVFLGGCTANKLMCPAQDTIDMVWTPFGSVIIQTEKGAYSKERHSIEKFKEGDGWITLEEYEAWVAELEKEQEAQDSI